MKLANVQFTMQAVISASALVFSMVMLGRGGDTGTYLPVLTSIVGYWLPAPTRPVSEGRIAAAAAAAAVTGNVPGARRRRAAAFDIEAPPPQAPPPQAPPPQAPDAAPRQPTPFRHGSSSN